MITPITPTLFKVSATVKEISFSQQPTKPKRYTFIVASDNGELARAKVRLYLRSESLEAFTFCDGKPQPLHLASEALSFAKSSGASIEARKLSTFINHAQQNPNYLYKFTAQEFSRQYRELADA